MLREKSDGLVADLDVMPARPEAEETAYQRKRIFLHHPARAILGIEDVPAVPPHPGKAARAHGPEAHAGERVEDVVAHVETDQRPVANLEHRNGLFFVREEYQLLADAEERVADEEREPAVFGVDAVDAPEKGPERADDEVGGLLVQIGG